jgi:hypothetical protein
MKSRLLFLFTDYAEKNKTNKIKTNNFKQMKKIILILMMFVAFIGTSLAGLPGGITVTMYGKGGATVIHNPDGTTSVQICAEASNNECAVLTIGGNDLKNADSINKDPEVTIILSETKETIKCKLSEIIDELNKRLNNDLKK